MIEQTDKLKADPLKGDPLAATYDPLGKEAGKAVDHYYNDWGVALSPWEREGAEKYKAAVDKSVETQQGILGNYQKEYKKQMGAANSAAQGILADAQGQVAAQNAKIPTLNKVPVSIYSDGWGSKEQTYYIDDRAAKKLMTILNRERNPAEDDIVGQLQNKLERRDLVVYDAESGSYKINSKGYGKELHEALNQAQAETATYEKVYNDYRRAGETAIGGIKDAISIGQESANKTYTETTDLLNKQIEAEKGKWTTYVSSLKTAFAQGVANNSGGLRDLVNSGALNVSAKVNK